MRVGIPRALWYYRDCIPWRIFLEALGAEVVVSPPTNRVLLAEGTRYTVPEACLPLKVFCGHVRALIGQCDALLVPAFYRFTADATNCAKLIGLPDVLQATMEDLPPLIAPDVDLSKGKSGLWALAAQVGMLFTVNPLSVRDAAVAAWSARTSMNADLRAGLTTVPELMGDSRPKHRPAVREGEEITVALAGHPYNLYDEFVSQSLLARLGRLGVEVVLPERLGPEPAVGDYWAFEYEFVGVAKAAARRADVDGLLAVVAFGCGPDGVMLERVQQTAAQARLPVMALTLDEHSGEAGLLTRLEAFLDMIRWRRTAQSHGRVSGY
jgi:predicted nucleotide-binding protein (sugar kinase/HSP70/actin superfamily)